MAHVYAIGIEQQDRAQHARALRLDDTQQQIECFLQRRPLRNQFQNLILASQQLRVFARRLFRLLTRSVISWKKIEIPSGEG